MLSHESFKAKWEGDIGKMNSVKHVSRKAYLQMAS